MTEHIIGNKMPTPLKEQADEQNKDRSDAIELGKYLVATVDDYIKAHSDLKGNVVVAAANYIVELFQERTTALGLHHSQMWGHLRDEVAKEGLAVHTPYANDNIPSNIMRRPQQGRQE